MSEHDRVVEARGLRKTFGERIAVDDVGFHIGAGETYGLLGPNGAGKTTTISMVCGLLERDAGEVTVAGRRVDTRATDAREAIGYVPQELALYPDLTGRENLRFFGRMYSLTGDELARRVDDVLEIVDLRDRANDRAGEYSGGMKRRLNIALGLLNRPKLLVLDEPTVGVDPQSRNSILSSVERFREQGLAVLYTTHYMEEAERLCDRVGIIDEGRLMAEGTRRELVATVGEQDRVRLGASGDLGAAEAAVRRLPAVVDASRRDEGIDLVVSAARTALPQILASAAEAGADVTTVEVTEPNLEAVFLHLTGKALRD
ncbi:MAG: ATP-binding cassette domain-containing protein [Actinomycetota bacterium]